MIAYKVLLEKYMRDVIGTEGCACMSILATEDWFEGCGFTKKELGILVKMKKKLYEETYGK